MLTVEEARALVEEHGGQSAAAKAVGVSQMTVWRWLNPDRYHEVQKKYRTSSKGRATARRYIEVRRDEGLCAGCGNERMSEWYCWDCLNKQEERYALSL